MTNGKLVNTRFGALRAFLARALVRLIVFAALVLAGLAIYLMAFGFPEWMAAELVKRVNLGVFHLETSRVRLDLLNGFAFDDVRVYRKSVVGPPAIEAARAVVSVNPLALFTGESALREVRLSDGEIRPFLAAGPAEPQIEKPAEPAPEMNFHVYAQNCGIMSVNVEALSCGIRIKGPALFCDSIEATLRNKAMRGELDGNGSYDAITKLLEMRLSAKLDPRLLLPVIHEWNMPFTAKLVQRFNFRSPPRCDLRFSRICDTNASFALAGQFWLQDCKYVGVDILRADGNVSLNFSGTNSVVAVRPLLIVRPEGMVSGGFAVDTARGDVRFEGSSGIDPKALLKMAGVFTNDELRAFRFGAPLRLTAKGSVNYGEPALADFEATCETGDMGIGPIDAERCSFTMRMMGLTNVFTNVTGRAYGGDFAGSAVFTLPSGERTNVAYAVAGNIKDADFSKLVRGRKGDGQDYKGQVTARLSLEGLMGAGNSNTTRGDGSIAIKEGRVFLLPVFGGLSRIMTKIIPGLDFVLRQTDADANFKIAEGKIHTEKVRVEGDILSLSGKGDYYLDGRLDFDVQLRLLKEHTLTAKILRIPTYLFSKLFELRLRGTYDDPHWYPINFSKDLLEKLHITDKKE